MTCYPSLTLAHHQNQHQQTILEQGDVPPLQTEDRVEEKEEAEQQKDPGKDQYEGSDHLVLWVLQMGQLWWRGTGCRRQGCLLMEASDKEQGGV